MMTTKLNTDSCHQSSNKKDKEGTGGSCRLFKARTRSLVQRAILTVCELNSLKLPSPSFKSDTCLGLYKEVKELLAREVSDVPEIQMAYQSIKKLLPDACPCMQGSMLEDLKTRLTRPARCLPSGYKTHCQEIVSKLFPPGWDKNWESSLETFSPSLGSCIGTSRKNGGQLSVLADDGQQSWLDDVSRPHGSLRGELLVVNSSGKPRSLTRFEAESSYLRPLHGLIYDQLSKQPWLLRGDVTSEKLRKAGFSGEKDNTLISGDYVSASDNLPIEIAELILNVLWSNSRSVPASVLRYAMAAQRPELKFERSDHLIDSFIPTVGQMMGSYLCFPLLCLQNYLAFSWAMKKAEFDCPAVLINGDDILFEGNESLFSTWENVITEVGFEVERSKTSLSKDWGTINSTLLRRKGGNIVPIRTTRMGMLRPSRHPSNLGASFETFSKVGRKSTWFTKAKIFLRWHIYLLKWGCVAQDMGFSGALAKHTWKYAFGGSLWKREVVLRVANVPSLEPAPCPHNIVMKSNEFQSFSPDQVGKKVVKAIGRWMAARKWQLGKSFEPSKPSTLLRKAQSKICRLSQWLSYRSMKQAAKDVELLYSVHGMAITGSASRFEVTPDGMTLLSPGRSYWGRPEKCTDVRVPVALLEEFDLAPQHISVDMVLSRFDRSLFGRGFDMLFNLPAQEESVKRHLNIEGWTL